MPSETLNSKEQRTLHIYSTVTCRSAWHTSRERQTRLPWHTTHYQNSWDLCCPHNVKEDSPNTHATQLSKIQKQFNLLDEHDVFKPPEDGLVITVEFLNPSFLLKKPNGEFHLVSAFADVYIYTKSQPSLIPNVDSILLHIAQWRYITVSDLTKSFYQIRLSKTFIKILRSRNPISRSACVY